MSSTKRLGVPAGGVRQKAANADLKRAGACSALPTASCKVKFACLRRGAGCNLTRPLAASAGRCPDAAPLKPAQRLADASAAHTSLLDSEPTASSYAQTPPTAPAPARGCK